MNTVKLTLSRRKIHIEFAKSDEHLQESQASPAQSNLDAWQEFFRLGDTLDEAPTPGIATMTATILAMRR